MPPSTSLTAINTSSASSATPPPSPRTSSSPLSTHATPPPIAHLEDTAEASDASNFVLSSSSDDDSDYSPHSNGNSKKHKETKRKSIKRRRLIRASDNKNTEKVKKLQASDVSDECKAVTLPSTSQSKYDKKTAAATWADDGSFDLYRRRIHELSQEFRDSVDKTWKTFYNNPQPHDLIKDKTNGKTFRENENEVETGPRFYTPWDVTETASGLIVPCYVLTQLLPHQRECLEWLHKLHERGVGGIVGDDMGLGKSVQLASFIGSLHGAKRLRTVLLLSPASVLLQWVRELHKWAPWMRVVLLHASGTGVTTSLSSESYEALIDEVFRFEEEEVTEERPTTGGVVISTYENVRQYQSMFLTREWDYVVLDEGHRIRNPDAETTLACKQLRTVHRIILSGTPIQNRLRELWSLFDFVYPGRLGTLPTFDDEFVLPIRAGGYATATKMQVLMAYKCALALKDLIEPFLLRRTKQEIQNCQNTSNLGTLLPEKQEQIIFCRLTKRQRALYKRFLASPEVALVLHRDIRPFRAIMVLRHICNHPDLLASFGNGGFADKKRQSYDEDDQDVDNLASLLEQVDNEDEMEESDSVAAFGDAAASGKMMVLQKILSLWKEQGHRVLIFTQTRSMLDILESFMSRLGHNYTRLDGTTNVTERQQRLDAFNASESTLFVFLLTTRAGGIGINLVGADRVVVFDPDWNPSTDVQARERAWRIGQQKPVTVYRLVTAGTIEEKIYHRQIFKQYLTSKVLHDAKRKRCFNKHTLRDLFVLEDDKEGEDGVVETSELFVAGNVDRPVEGDSPNQTTSSEGDTNAGDNDAVLKQLFDGGGVRGVFDHAAVELEGVQNQEADLVEIEATKVAKGALSALRASGALVRQQRESIYTPTWTGRSGAAGDPSQRRQPALRGRGTLRGGRGRTHGVSSREMLAKIKQRRDGVATSGVKSLTSSGPALSASEMTKRLHAFLVANPTGVTTERLLESFANVIAPKDKLVFRHVLRDIALCQGRRWTLKSKYDTLVLAPTTTSSTPPRRPGMRFVQKER